MTNICHKLDGMVSGYISLPFLMLISYTCHRVNCWLHDISFPDGKSWKKLVAGSKGRFDFAFCPLRVGTFVSVRRYSLYWEDRSGSFGRAAHREVPKKRLHIAGEPERPLLQEPSYFPLWSPKFSLHSPAPRTLFFFSLSILSHIKDITNQRT